MELYELTNPQKSIWLTEQYYKGTSVNTLCGTVLIKEKINYDLLNKAINLFVENNDAFRLHIVLDSNGNPKQYVTDFLPLNLEVISLKDINKLHSLEQKMIEYPFNIIDSNLYDLKVFSFPDKTGGFIVKAHHLICDACTAGLIASKIVGIYSSLLKNDIESIPSFSYIDYVNSEREYLKSDKFVVDKEFWDSQFTTVEDFGIIPTLNSTVQNVPSARRETFIVDKEFTTQINDFCKINKISIFNFLMAVYSIYIGSVSNLNKFILGTPILNRTTFTEKNTPGMFISTVPLTFDITKDISFVDYAKNITTDLLSIFRHQKYPYQNILETIRKKEPNRPNLYDILISYQNTRTTAKHSDVPFEVNWTFNNNVSDSMQIHIYDMNDDGILNISYDYRLSKYSIEDIKNTHNRILAIIKQVLNNSNISLHNIEIVSPDEKDIILKKFNDTEENYTFSDNIVTAIENIAIEKPNIIAIETENSCITYRELILRINQLSNYLLEHNIPEKSNIGIFTTRTIDTIVGILSVLKINCTYVPIDSEYPIDRINYMLNTSEIQYILSENEKVFNIISNYNTLKNICINYSIYQNEPTSFEKKYNYDNKSNLYIIFTSGSTGNPKGVTISHKNMMNLIMFEKHKTDIFKLSDNKILQFATMSFDVSYQEIFSALLLGNTLVLIDDDARKNMNDLSKYIVNKQIDTLFIPPAYLRLLVEDSKIKSMIISQIKDIITAGEPLIITNDIQDLIQAGVILHNHYGPAETHVATSYTIKRENVNSHPPIGKPISNSEIHIFNKNYKLCPLGIIGEIAISGDCVGNGYWNNKILTEKKFRINPYNNKKMYLTGDLGFWDYNGNVHFVGRSDFQIKINGYRIELEEIDHILSKHPKVKSSISIVHEENSKKYIITYFIENNDVDENSLLEYLNDNLPFYMIPKRIIKVNSFPITPNGKIDRKKFPKVVLSDLTYKYDKPQTNTELQLTNIWQQLFNNNKIGINYNFFDIGGDSLLAIKLSAMILSVFNVNISVKDIFDNPNIYELSKLIDNMQQIKCNQIIHCQEKEYYNLSDAQKRIYYSSKASGDNSTLYNMPGYIVFDKEPDIEKLNKCFNILIKRHSSLRTYFELIDGNVYQKIKDNIDFKLRLEKTNKTKDEIIINFIEPFNLSKAPLFRVKFVNLNNNFLLLFDMHHIISDGVSVSILIKELCKLYNNEDLEPIKFNYIDYAEWEFNNLKNNLLKDSKEFWLNKFNGEIPLLDLPTDYTRPAKQSFEGAKVHSNIDKELTSKINSLAKKLNASPYMLLLACYYILLYKYTSNTDIIVGTATIGRNMDSLLNILGMFVNTLPLRNSIEKNMSFCDFLETVKNNFLIALEHQNYPFNQLISDLKIARDTSRNPLFDTMFIYQNNGFSHIDFNGVSAKLELLDTHTSKFDLSLEVVPENEGLSLNFEYCTKLFNKNTIRSFSEHFINILKTIVENSSIKIGEIDILSSEERKKILYDFNNTKMDYPKDKTIIQLFEEQVEKTPDNIAIVFEDKKITYKELNEKANCLAWYLREQGINRNDIISIMVNRSLELLVSIIGVLKSGACYIPIDPNYPSDRINYMLKNSDSKILLTDQSSYNNIDFDNKIIIDLSNYTFRPNNNNLPNINKPNDTSYIIYTSGSTGNPKGVILKHQSLTNLAYYLNDYVCFFKDAKYTTMGSVTTASFDIFIFETLMCLQKGLKVAIANEEEQRLPSKLDEFITNNNVKAIQMTPSRMRIFIDNIEYCPNLKNLDYVVLAGEPLPDILLQDLLKIGIKKVYNGYGPSETTVFSSFTDVTDYSIVNIGKPLYNTQMYILDQNLLPVPTGIPGELYISGDGVGKGYLNNEEITTKSFINNPFEKDAIMYKTGDMCKFLDNGEIQYIGRIDNQIKIHGIRIELNEIEKWIIKYPNIQKCIVTVKEDSNNRPFVIAYLIVNSRVSISNLRSYLSNYLPRYMIPSYFMILEAFPYLPNGKINKKALPLPNLSAFGKKDNYIAPKDNLELQIVNAFQKILGISPISVTDSFFELGGDSLLAISLQIELMKISNNVTYSDIFMLQTPQELAEKLHTYLNSYSSTLLREDFTTISNILNETISIPNSINEAPLGDILLTGATGFLGAHILDEYLKNTNTGKIYCLIRNEIGLTLEKKLLDKLHFYFNDKYDKLIGNRIIIINGDISKYNLGLSDEIIEKLKKNITTVINSAAIVSHYGNYSDFKKINVDGVQNIIDFCKKYKKKLYQISTLSVSGNTFDTGSYINQVLKDDVIFRENNLFINQSLNNVYVRSKFEAEKLILEEINAGLDGYILRIGNLMPRWSDGKFQINASENAYANRLLSFIKIKMMPDYLLNNYAEFTPVDSCSQAIIKIIKHPTNKNRIFHLFNHNHVNVTGLLTIFREFEDFQVLNENNFIKEINKLLKSSNSDKILGGIVKDFDSNKHLIYESNIKINSDFSIKYLQKINFKWPIINNDYLKRFIKYLLTEE